MTPDEREFGVLIGEVRGISKQVAELQRANTAEHEANARRMERIEAKLETGLDKKADKTDLNDLDEKVDSLRLTRAGNTTRDNILKGAFGAVLTIIAVLLGGHIHL
jgi:hypothetical protein